MLIMTDTINIQLVLEDPMDSGGWGGVGVGGMESIIDVGTWIKLLHISDVCIHGFSRK